MSNHEEVLKICNEIKSAGGRHTARIAELESLTGTLRKQLDELSMRSDRPGDPIGGLSGPSPGTEISENHEALEQLKRTGRYAFEFEGQSFRPPANAATITSSGLGYPGAAIMTPDRRGDFIELSRPRLVIRDVIPSRPVTSGEFHFVAQATKGIASPQVEGSEKFETSITWTPTASVIKTVTSLVHASRQALDDLPSLRRAIDSDLMNAVEEKEQEELLAGDGTGQHLNGLITQAEAFETGRINSNDSKLDFLRHAVSQLEESDEDPTFIALHPKDFWDVRGLKVEGDMGAYVLPIATEAGIWLPVVRTTSMTSGSFLVGSSSRAEILDRQRLTIMLSFEHGDNFTKNLVTLLAESRIGLAVYASSGFVEGDFTGASPA